MQILKTKLKIALLDAITLANAHHRDNQFNDYRDYREAVYNYMQYNEEISDGEAESIDYDMQSEWQYL